jgi:hypothetical protein
MYWKFRIWELFVPFVNLCSCFYSTNFAWLWVNSEADCAWERDSARWALSHWFYWRHEHWMRGERVNESKHICCVLFVYFTAEYHINDFDITAPQPKNCNFQPLTKWTWLEWRHHFGRVRRRSNWTMNFIETSIATRMCDFFVTNPQHPE